MFGGQKVYSTVVVNEDGSVSFLKIFANGVLGQYLKTPSNCNGHAITDWGWTTVARFLLDAPPRSAKFELEWAAPFLMSFNNVLPAWLYHRLQGEGGTVILVCFPMLLAS